MFSIPYIFRWFYCRIKEQEHKRSFVLERFYGGGLSYACI